MKVQVVLNSLLHGCPLLSVSKSNFVTRGYHFDLSDGVVELVVGDVEGLHLKPLVAAAAAAQMLLKRKGTWRKNNRRSIPCLLFLCAESSEPRLK